jgi:hypothetical protein
MGQRKPVRKPRVRTAVSTPVAVPVESVPDPVRAVPAPLRRPPVPRAASRLDGQQRAALEAVGSAAEGIRDLQDALASLVASARSRGVSWALIGSAVGTTGEAARQRWGRE